jgi:hypothetical protein
MIACVGYEVIFLSVCYSLPTYSKITANVTLQWKITAFLVWMMKLREYWYWPTGLSWMKYYSNECLFLLVVGSMHWCVWASCLKESESPFWVPSAFGWPWPVHEKCSDLSLLPHGMKIARSLPFWNLLLRSYVPKSAHGCSDSDRSNLGYM